MRHTYRLLLAISTLLLILSACASDVSQESNRTEDSTVLTSSQESGTEETENESENVEEQTESSEKAEETVQTPAVEASAEPEDTEATEDDAYGAEEETTSADSHLTELEQAAVEAVLAVLDLEMEQYSYLFTHEEDYIEIEIRENTYDNQFHAPLEGIYRYYPVTQEIFISDYLTGDFILYEEYQALKNN